MKKRTLAPHRLDIELQHWLQPGIAQRTQIEQAADRHAASYGVGRQAVFARDDRAVGPHTRLLVVTEGVLTARLVDDPALTDTYQERMDYPLWLNYLKFFAATNLVVVPLLAFSRPVRSYFSKMLRARPPLPPGVR